MMYLTDNDADILFGAVQILVVTKARGELTTEGNKLVDDCIKLYEDSIEYTKKCRDKAKKFVQEKRKTDKTYAHKKKEK